MYMLVVVCSGSSIRILYPREAYSFWVDTEGPVRIVYKSTTWYLVSILHPREYYDSWEDPKFLVRTVCQSTTNNVADAPASFYCHTMMMFFFQPCPIDDVVVLASFC